VGVAVLFSRLLAQLPRNLADDSWCLSSRDVLCRDELRGAPLPHPVHQPPRPARSDHPAYYS
jgi:hypothetical protein